MRKQLAAVALAAGLGVAGSAQAVVISNGGFDTGALAPWTGIGNTSVIGALGGISPAGAPNQAFLSNLSGAATTAAVEGFLGLSAGAISAFGTANVPNFGSAEIGSAIKQTGIQFNAGEVLKFDFNFLTNEQTPSFFNDFAFVSVSNGTDTLLFLADTNSAPFSPAPGTGFNEQSGWHHFTTTIATAGVYTIGFAVIEEGDTIINSGLLIDNVMPEPTSLALLGLGLAGLAWRMRRRPGG